jgi:hypothetical protein
MWHSASGVTGFLQWQKVCSLDSDQPLNYHRAAVIINEPLRRPMKSRLFFTEWASMGTRVAFLISSNPPATVKILYAMENYYTLLPVSWRQSETNQTSRWERALK